jgi:hypothetical protein
MRNKAYDVFVAVREEHVQKFEIAIRNVGTIAGEKVIVSVNAENAKVLNFTSWPFLGNHAVDNKSAQIGNALYEIDNFPPRSHKVVTVTLLQPPTEEQAELSTNVRSSKGVRISSSL